MTTGTFTSEELESARECIATAMRHGADAIRVSASKTLQNSICLLNGDIEKTTFSEERSFFFHIFANGRFGTFSTNRLDTGSLDFFLKKAVDTVLLLAKDDCRALPDPLRKATCCNRGDETGLLDKEYGSLTQEKRIKTALEAGNSAIEETGGIKLISLESEYSDCLDDSFIVDSDGFEGRHTETSYGFCTEATVRDRKGNKYSGYWWDGAPAWKDFHFSDIQSRAYALAAAQEGPRKINGGRYDIVVDKTCSSNLVSPIINALDGLCLQQGNSFLCGSLDKKVFSEEFSMSDMAIEKGCPGSRMFDSEGVRTSNETIIERGTIRKFFIDDFISRKTGWKATVNSPSRPCIKASICNCCKKEINLEDIVSFCGNGIYVCAFNGGNCNPATGNFSYGIEGFRFENGNIIHPVREMVMTGNIIDMFNKLKAVGSDARKCTRWQIPTLAFEKAEINN